MKTFLFIISALVVGLSLISCSEDKDVAVQPQVIHQSAIQNSITDRNLRPATGEKPDLKIYPFFVSGSVTLVSGIYKIPISFKELNIGIASTGYGSDTLKVYQKIPTPITGFYSFRLLNSFVRTANIPAGGTWYLNAVVNFPSKWRPSTGKINLVITADGSNTIAELDETNNVSDTIWNIYLP